MFGRKILARLNIKSFYRLSSKDDTIEDRAEQRSRSDWYWSIKHAAVRRRKILPATVAPAMPLPLRPLGIFIPTVASSHSKLFRWKKVCPSTSSQLLRWHVDFHDFPKPALS